MLEKRADMLVVVESETLRNTLNNVEAEARLDLVVETVAVVQNRKILKNTK